MEVLIASEVMYENKFDGLVVEDILWVVIAVGFLYVILIVYLDSIFVASVAFFQFLMNLPISGLIMSAVFGVRYVGPYHAYAILFVLCKSSNDVLVFMDQWRLSQRIIPIHLKMNDRSGRMAYAFRQSRRTLFFSTVVLIFGFLAHQFSTIFTPLASLSAFAAISSAVSYLMTILAFPCSLIVDEDHVKNKINC